MIAGLIEAFYQRLWNAWDDAAVPSVLADGFEFRGSLGLSTRGLDEWRGYRDLIRAGSADFHNTVVRLVCEGSRAAARLRYVGTHTGTLLGIPATGRRFEYAGAAFFEASAGPHGERLTSAWVLGDVASLREQLTAPMS